MLIGPLRVFRQVVGKAKEGEGRRLLGRSPVPLQQAAVEVQQRCLLGRDPQPKGRQPLFHFLPKPLGIRVVLETPLQSRPRNA